ncbi:cytochrome P450 [Cryphonectria parasitica EP155]|uniref:Cytochrome P450 n=1 Tax=Cryphonectria parasitica (strain ATCC 38755 / EP155) TaxID=660469 RepID=A0A9P5CS26_CRYP1|nr:cytochrome P450 [Cryphonectria parasitica EP155]KAF3768858.1 cytochrome P450 [Cryphonectria parasitica EP155]
MALGELASGSIEGLSTKWPFILTTLLALVGTWLLQLLFKQDPLSKIPFAGSDIGDENKRRVAFMQDAKAIYADGYQKFKNSLFRITSSRESHVIVVDPLFLRELKDLPDDVLSFSGAIEDIMHPRYTNIRSDRAIVPHVVKRDLTPSLSRLNPVIAEEVDLAFQEEFPQSKEFTAVPLNKHLLRVVSKVSGRIFVGPELCRTEEYIDMGINYTLDLMSAVNAISQLKPSKRDVTTFKLPEVEKLRQRQQNSYTFIKPMIEARKKAMKEDPDFQKPDDIMQWILDDGQSKYGEQDDQELTEIQLGLTFAAIHTTTLSTTNAFYNIAAMPELIPELREEIRGVLREYGTFTSAALQKMKKLDSFLRESMRVYPLSLASFSRKVLKPIVLSNGQVIPAGCIIEVPSYHTMHDPDMVENPDKFDAFRWSRLRENEEVKGVDRASVGAANQLVTVSPVSLNFGYGRHACPGRFFAANEIKMIVGRALLDYDIKMVDGETERYKNVVFAESVSWTDVTSP